MMGDSKTDAGYNVWPARLGGPIGDNLGVSGASTSSTASGISAILARSVANPPDDVRAVLINLGANDSVTYPQDSSEHTTWVSNYQTILDAVHTKFRYATVYIVKPWRRPWTVNQSGLIATWVNEVVASRAFTAVGHDERGWLEGGDNGATMTYDGVHYSTAGEAEVERQWRLIVGP